MEDRTANFCSPVTTCTLPTVPSFENSTSPFLGAEFCRSASAKSTSEIREHVSKFSPSGRMSTTVRNGIPSPIFGGV